MEFTLYDPSSGFSVNIRVVYLGNFQEIYSCLQIISITACDIAEVQRVKSSNTTIEPLDSSKLLIHIGTAYPIRVSSVIVHPALRYSEINSDDIQAH